MGKSGKSYLPNLQPLIAAGINPKTGLPYKMSPGNVTNLKSDMLRLIEKMDEQDAINRYTWYNLPGDMTGRLIEEILYYKGQGMFFYMETNNTFYFLPYALNGTIDVYNRFTGVNPVPLGSTVLTDKEKKTANGAFKLLLKSTIKYPIYKPLDDVPTLEDIKNKCVLLKDYSNFIDQTEIPRKVLNQPLLDVMSDIIPYMNTALSNSTGVVGMRVPDDDCEASVQAANEQTKQAALSGQRYIPVTGSVDFQELASGNTLKSADFMQALESLDNFRLSLYGIKNGGLFQKKAHMLEDEQALASGNVGLVMQDGLTLRQEFCNRVNSIWPLGIWCEVSEVVAGIDKNMDGEISDEQDEQYPVDTVGGEEDVTE